VKALLVLFAVLSGSILIRLGLPASFLTGPLLVAAIFAVTNRPVIRFPLFIYRLAQSVIGVMLSFTITAKSLQTIAVNWALIATLVITMLALTTLIGVGLSRFANLQAGTALLAALLGGRCSLGDRDAVWSIVSHSSNNLSGRTFRRRSG